MKSFLGKLSLGNIGQSSYACNSASALGSETFNLYCAYGTLNTIVEFGQSLKSSDSQCATDGNGLVFTPKTCSYNDGFNETVVQYLDEKFDSVCKGKSNCSYPLNVTVIPPYCKSGLEASNIIYFMQVGCKSDTVNLFGSNSVEV